MVWSPKRFAVSGPDLERLREKLVDHMKGQLREKRVHPSDPKQKPDTYEGYLSFARSQRFPTDAEAIHFANKMWKESHVHVSSDIPEGQ